MKEEHRLKLRLANLGKKQSKETIAKRIAHYKGVPLSMEHRRKIAEAQKGEKGNNWKGEKATYNSLHHWVRRTYGRPTECEFCLQNFTGYKIQWANKTGKYLRTREDWLRLCAGCHKIFEETIKTKRIHSHE